MIKRLLRDRDDVHASRTSRAVALMIASTVNTLLSLLLSMVAARVLTKTELAINSQAFLIYSTFASLLTLGIPSGIYYYLVHNEHRKRAVVNESILLTLGTSLMFSLFILCGGNQVLANAFHNPQIAELLYWLIPYALFMVPMNVISCVFVYENRIRFNAVFSATQTFVILAVVIVSMLIFRTGESMIVSRVIVSIAFVVVAGIVLNHILPKEESSKVNLSSIKSLFYISIPLGLADIVATLDRSLDKWIVSIMLSPERYAVFMQGARELPLIGTITGAISTVMLVDITRAAKDDDFTTAVALFRKIAEKTSLILLPVMIFLFVTASPFIRFLYTEAYADAIPIFQIYLLYLPIRTVVYGPLLIALGKSKYILVRSIIGLCLNALLSILAVYLLGAAGAALATILVLYLFNLPSNLYVISKATGIKWTKLLPFRRIGLSILLTIPGAALCIVARVLFTASLAPLNALIIEATLFAASTGALLTWKFQLPVKSFCELGIRYIKRLKKLNNK
ncbi:MAG: oligosaccharide flippase family protein [Clostridiales bacterium]|jgi:O-antigen/teichoic acid export membrane protein|nr:oligosaccharide flippase family protein [Clostridiales bacterium]